MDEIISLLKQIKANQEKASRFDVGTAFALALAAAVSFVIALALNNALQASFALIPVGSNAILGYWIYAVIALILGLVLLFIIYRYFQPWIHRKMDK